MKQRLTRDKHAGSSAVATQLTRACHGFEIEKILVMTREELRRGDILGHIIAAPKIVPFV
ncbi:MAG: hypothetical protein K5905_26250 [Roseibium sp.]|uniref:hypothetical protein n=1 Tax=Roseibium sp. TaxID=1936156 RepID=UPI002620824A|nr:hypothetical protein [Roseibium sp.]MCV0428971.1 hypothetical protein [Roseibium sp.]